MTYENTAHPGECSAPGPCAGCDALECAERPPCCGAPGKLPGIAPSPADRCRCRCHAVRGYLRGLPPPEEVEALGDAVPSLWMVAEDERVGAEDPLPELVRLSVVLGVVREVEHDGDGGWVLVPAHRTVVGATPGRRPQWFRPCSPDGSPAGLPSAEAQEFVRSVLDAAGTLRRGVSRLDSDARVAATSEIACLMSEIPGEVAAFMKRESHWGSRPRARFVSSASREPTGDGGRRFWWGLTARPGRVTE